MGDTQTSYGYRSLRESNIAHRIHTQGLQFAGSRSSSPTGILDAFAEVFAQMNSASVPQQPLAPPPEPAIDRDADSDPRDEDEQTDDSPKPLLNEHPEKPALSLTVPVDDDADAQHVPPEDSEQDVNTPIVLETAPIAAEAKSVEQQSDEGEAAPQTPVVDGEVDAKKVDAETTLLQTTEAASPPAVEGRQRNTNAPAVAGEMVKAESENGKPTVSTNQPTDTVAAVAADNDDSLGSGQEQSEHQENRRRYSNRGNRANEANAQADAAERAQADSQANNSVLNRAKAAIASAENASLAESLGNSPPNSATTAAANGSLTIDATSAASVSAFAAKAASAATPLADTMGKTQASGNSGTSSSSLESPSSANRSSDSGKQAGKSSDSSTSDLISRAKLIQRVSKAFQHLGPDGGHVRLRLAPAELGTVRLEMRIQANTMQARVVAETEAAASALREHLPELRMRLESQGMKIQKLDIEVESESQANDATNSGEHSESQGHDAWNRNSNPSANRWRTPRSEPNPAKERNLNLEGSASSHPAGSENLSTTGVDVRL